ncbi:MAG: biotin/lipoyl-containing protein [Pseudomonadota bacterium]
MVQPGQQVAECETLMIMEVMKMEVPYEAPAAGLVTAVHVTEGEVVEEGVIAVEIG